MRHLAVPSVTVSREDTETQKGLGPVHRAEREHPLVRVSYFSTKSVFLETCVVVMVAVVAFAWLLKDDVITPGRFRACPSFGSCQTPRGL